MKKGFSLIEMLIVLSIIGIIMGISLFSIQNSKKTQRDATRKRDLEEIRSALEMYKADCGAYPPSINFGNALSCASAGITYTSSLPNDPLSATGRSYNYIFDADNNTYLLCAAIESQTTSIEECGVCGNSNCTYSLKNP